MKTRKLTAATLAFIVFGASVCSSPAVVGYVNYPFQPGPNLFGNPLTTGSDLLSTVILTAPVGTTVSLWNSSTSQYTQTSVFNGVNWSPNLTLAPGTGALLITPTPFTNTFVGSVVDASGNNFTGQLNPPPAFSGPAGLYLWSSKFPVSFPFSTGTEYVPTNTTYDAFTLLVGRAPEEGEQVWRYNPGFRALS